MPELLLKQIQVFCVEFLNVFIDLTQTEASIILNWRYLQLHQEEISIVLFLSLMTDK